MEDGCARGPQTASCGPLCASAARPRAREASASQGQGSRGGGGALGAPKKSAGDLGGRGRRHGAEERRMIILLVAEAVGAGARFERACEVIGIAARTVARWKSHDVGDDQRR